MKDKKRNFTVKLRPVLGGTGFKKDENRISKKFPAGPSIEPVSQFRRDFDGFASGKSGKCEGELKGMEKKN